MSDDDVLFDQIGEALRLRGGWRFAPSSSPGGAPSWSLEPGGEPIVSISVQDGRILAYIPATDREVPFPDIADMLRWMDQRETGPT